MYSQQTRQPRQGRDMDCIFEEHSVEHSVSYLCKFYNGSILTSHCNSPISQNAPDKHSTIHRFVTEMCTHVHISVTKWCIVGYGTGAMLDLSEKPLWICATGLLVIQCTFGDLLHDIRQNILDFLYVSKSLYCRCHAECIMKTRVKRSPLLTHFE